MEPQPERGVFRQYRWRQELRKVLFVCRRKHGVLLDRSPGIRTIRTILLRVMWLDSSGKNSHLGAHGRGTGQRVFTSTDSGATWKRLERHGMPKRLSEDGSGVRNTKSNLRTRDRNGRRRAGMAKSPCRRSTVAFGRGGEHWHWSIPTGRSRRTHYYTREEKTSAPDNEKKCILHGGIFEGRSTAVQRSQTCPRACAWTITRCGFDRLTVSSQAVVNGAGGSSSFNRGHTWDHVQLRSFAQIFM